MFPLLAARCPAAFVQCRCSAQTGKWIKSDGWYRTGLSPRLTGEAGHEKTLLSIQNRRPRESARRSGEIVSTTYPSSGLARRKLTIVLRGLDPRIHVFASSVGRRGWPGRARPRRLCMVRYKTTTRLTCHQIFPGQPRAKAGAQNKCLNALDSRLCGNDGNRARDSRTQAFHTPWKAGIQRVSRSRPESLSGKWPNRRRKGGNEAGRASRRALWALLSMRKADGIEKIPHPEEAAKRPSRRTHGADPANRRFPDSLLRRDDRRASQHLVPNV
jgi:hypothetical protein